MEKEEEEEVSAPMQERFCDIMRSALSFVRVTLLRRRNILFAYDRTLFRKEPKNEERMDNEMLPK